MSLGFFVTNVIIGYHMYALNVSHIYTRYNGCLLRIIITVAEDSGYYNTVSI